MSALPALQIERASPDLKADCAQLWLAGMGDIPHGLGVLTEGDFDRQTEGEEIFVALRDGALAGLLSLWRPEPFIHFLMVAGSQRRSGIGTALLRFAGTVLPSPVHLKCSIANEKALAFYRAEGCTEVDRVLAAADPHVVFRLPF